MSVNRRKRLGSRGSGSSVCKGPIMAHVGFEGARHMHPERMPSGKREKTVSLRLFDLNNETIENVDNHSSTVRRLMIHGLKLTALTEDLVNKMKQLEKLDLGENQLGDLPDSFKQLENLVELNLNNNKFNKIPPSVRKLRNLTRLNLSHNSIDSLKGLEKLKKMQVLMLDHNKFSHVFKEISHMKKLEILDCSFNNIREVGLDVRNLKNLKELNISKNRISVLPTDVFQLINLESLKASQNQISKIPVFNLNPQHCRSMAEIDLAGNTLNKFPGHLLLLTKKLDLTSNRIKALDWNKMKKIEVKSEQELFVEGNPLTFPPADVCECGLKSMMQFFQETQSTVRVYQGVKVLVLGAHDSGKTSFVQTLADGQARLSEEMYEKSAGIETSEMNFDNHDEQQQQQQQQQPNQQQKQQQQQQNQIDVTSAKLERSASKQEIKTNSENTQTHNKTLNLTLWDFCGHSFYLFPHYMFFEQPAIAILTFNMFKYKSELFHDMIGSWFDWMIAKTNKLCVLLVGTHSDKMKKEKIKTVCDEVKSKLSAHAERQRQIVQKRIDVITDKPHISQTLSSQLNSYSSLLQEKFIVQSEVIVTSAANNTGYETIRASIELLSNDSKQFPNVLRPIPTFWLDVETYTEEKGNSMIVPIMKFDAYKEEIGQKFGMKHLLNTIVQYLHETGKVLWFSNNSALKGLIILRPAWFFDIFRSLFRHDLKEKLDIEVEDSFKTIVFEDPDAGITQTRYDQLKEEFLKEGILDRDLLKCMFSGLLPLETNGPFYEVINVLLNNLDLGYLVSKRPRGDSDYNLDPDPESMYSTKYLMPWFRQVGEPECVQKVWEPHAEKRKLTGVCRFPKYMPPGLFEMLSVRAHRKEHKFRFLSHWENGFHARHKEENLQVIFSYFKHDDSNGTTLKFEMRDDGDPNVDEVPASTMWLVLLPVLMEFEELLHSYTGVLVERLMECPNCRQLSFLGEWLTPKETQGMGTRACEECMEDIDTAFLVQPREKKRDDVRLNLARMRNHRRDALQTNNNNGEVVKAPVRQGRRAAVMPMDSLMMARPSISTLGDGNVGSDDEDDDDNKPSESAGFSLLPGLAGFMPTDLPPFLTGMRGSDDEEDEGSQVDDERSQVNGEPNPSPEEDTNNNEAI